MGGNGNPGSEMLGSGSGNGSDGRIGSGLPPTAIDGSGSTSASAGAAVSIASAAASPTDTAGPMYHLGCFIARLSRPSGSIPIHSHIVAAAVVLQPGARPPAATPDEQ
jgi:hypothetical protein